MVDITGAIPPKLEERKGKEAEMQKGARLVCSAGKRITMKYTRRVGNR